MFPIGYRGGTTTYHAPPEPPPPTFEVQFEDNKTIFYPNDVLAGHIRYLGHFGHSKHGLIQGILVSIVCNGELNHATRSTDQFFKRTYFFKEKWAYGGNGKRMIEIPKRGSIFPFEFKLPTNVAFPQTHVGLYGSVICTIEITLKCYDSGAPSFSQRLNLHDNLDLNNLKSTEELRRPVEKFVSDSGLFSRFSRNKQESHVLLIASKGAYAPGEILSFRTEVAHDSNRLVSSSRVEFIQDAIYTTSRSGILAKKTSKVIGYVDGPILTSNNFQAWEGVIEVPNVSCTTFGDAAGCIRIKYRLQFISKTEGWCTDVKAEVPIVIGAVGLIPWNSLGKNKHQSSFSLGDNTSLRKSISRFGSVSSFLNLGGSRRSSASSMNRLPDYFTAVQDVHLCMYPDAEMAPPTYDEAIVEQED